MNATAMAMVVIGLASAGEAETIRGCVRLNGGMLKSSDLIRAKQISSQIMATAEVSVQWVECGRSASKEEADAVIDLITDAPSDFHRGALAYALPFEGLHIVVMADRLLPGGPSLFPVLLGHVISHELAHLLQNCQLHSAKGIMKAHWTSSDFGEMLWRPMRFSAEDAEWIRLGMRLRRQTAKPRTTAEAREGGAPML